jgi:DNA-binding response OmpR family regulator
MVRQKILVVDDDPDLLKALRLRLRANEYDITTASDGYSAIASAQKDRPDLIILDLGLPVGDGFVVLDRLQASNPLSSIPVIVLTARDPQNNEDRALKAGAAAFFQKPVDNDELLNVIRVSLPRPQVAPAPWPSWRHRALLLEKGLGLLLFGRPKP